MSTDQTDLDWLAFSYAAGELNPAEAEQFESLLANDQPAREALARAVELCQTVAAAEAGVAVSSGRVAVFSAGKHGSSAAEKITLASRTHQAWNHRLSWMAVGSVASLLLAMFWTGVVSPTWHTAQLRSFSKQNLAFAWTQTNQQITTVREAGYWPAILADVADDNATTSPLDDSTDDAPSWMTAALLSASPAGSPADQATSDSNI